MRGGNAAAGDGVDLESSEYWKLLEKFLKEENLTLQKISKAVVSHYGVSASVYQDWIETYLQEADN